jgi:sporulation protein YlmC with PRC-barrel domain
VAIKLKSCLKRDVVTLAEGRNLGRPTDILIDPRQHVVSLLVLARGHVPDSTLFVSASLVRSFDTDTLAIDSVDSLRIAATDENALALLKQALDFRGHPLIDSQGRKLGKVVQIRIDRDGNVLEYRARRGLLGWFAPRAKISPGQLGTPGGEMGVVRDVEDAAAPTPVPAAEPAEPGPAVEE